MSDWPSVHLRMNFVMSSICNFLMVVSVFDNETYVQHQRRPTTTTTKRRASKQERPPLLLSSVAAASSDLPAKLHLCSRKHTDERRNVYSWAQNTNTLSLCIAAHWLLEEENFWAFRNDDDSHFYTGKFLDTHFIRTQSLTIACTQTLAHSREISNKKRVQNMRFFWTLSFHPISTSLNYGPIRSLALRTWQPY